MSAILIQTTVRKQYWHEYFALVPILLSGGRLGPILHSRVKYSGPYEKSHSITSKYYKLQMQFFICHNKINVCKFCSCKGIEDDVSCLDFWRGWLLLCLLYSRCFIFGFSIKCLCIRLRTVKYRKLYNVRA